MDSLMWVWMRERERGRGGKKRESGERKRARESELKPGPFASPVQFIKQTRCNYALTHWTFSSG